MLEWGLINKAFKAQFITDMCIKRRNRKVTACFVTLVIIQALTYVSLIFRGIFLWLGPCSDYYPNDNFFELFCRQIFPELFRIFTIQPYFGVFLLPPDIFVNFSWVFNDCFIIVVTLLIASYFERLNDRIRINLGVIFQSLFATFSKHFFAEQVKDVLDRSHQSLQASLQACWLHQQHAGHFNFIFFHLQFLYGMRRAAVVLQV